MKDRYDRVMIEMLFGHIHEADCLSIRMDPRETVCIEGEALRILVGMLLARCSTLQMNKNSAPLTSQQLRISARGPLSPVAQGKVSITRGSQRHGGIQHLSKFENGEKSLIAT